MPPDRPIRLSEVQYLRRVEALAHAVADRAFDEGWLAYGPRDEGLTPLKRSINEMARNLRSVHFDGDGCLDHDAEAT